MKSKISNIYRDSLQFLKSTDFSKASLLTIAITSPITIGIFLGYFEVGLAMALGALLSSPSDVSGSFRHTQFGILLSTIIAVIVSLMSGYVLLTPESYRDIILLPVLGISMFALSYISVFGFRASLISFSGLLAIVLSFANLSDLLEVYEKALFIGVGGLWYFSLVFIWNKLNPKGQTEQYLAETMNITAAFIDVRAELLTERKARVNLQQTLLQFQTELNEKHEVLREILISSRKSSGNSNYERNRLLIFMQLIDILELAIANPVDYAKMDQLTGNKDTGQILAFQNLIREMAKRLRLISQALQYKKKALSQSDLEIVFKSIKDSMSPEPTLEDNAMDERTFMFHNLFAYLEKQYHKIKKIEEILTNSDISKLTLMKKEEAAKFITDPEYDFKLLREHFSLKSPIFKHSLRLAIVVMLGYGIGVYFSLQNAYWILLTIIVIMRPNYGLTKTRSKQRTLGTLMGAVIATGIIFITQNQVVYGFLAIVSLLLALSLTQKNYKTSAVFITLSVVFIYALLQPNVLDVIQYRVIDTLIGASLATVGNILFWPSWEFFGMKDVIAENIKANRNYLKGIFRYYRDKKETLTEYKLTRKEAFLATGNLNAAFQRMTQEPKSKQKNLESIYEIVVLNHTFLSSLASLGTYIQNNPSEEVPAKFMEIISNIDVNLSRSLQLLGHYGEPVIPIFTQEDEASNISKTLQPENNTTSQIQAMQLMEDQLNWLHTLSEKLINKIESLPVN